MEGSALVRGARKRRTATGFAGRPAHL